MDSQPTLFPRRPGRRELTADERQLQVLRAWARTHPRVLALQPGERVELGSGWAIVRRPIEVAR